MKGENTMKDNKEMAMSEFCEMIRKSWTYGRMTVEEKARCFSAIQWTHEQGILRGNFNARWAILQGVYNAFLSGIGYDGFGWREPEEALYERPCM